MMMSSGPEQERSAKQQRTRLDADAVTENAAAEKEDHGMTTDEDSGATVQSPANNKAPPPFTNPDELAINVFAHPWFSKVEGAETQYKSERREAFGLKTIKDIRREFLEIGSYIESTLLYGKVSYERVEEYINSLDISTRQNLAEEDFNETFGGEFKTIDISIGTKLGALLPDASENDRVLDLSFLKDLRLPTDQEKLLSSEQIYVRNCMRRIFGLFCMDVDETAKKGKKRPDSRNTAFIGSPGVGTSVLSFCAALYQAQTTNVVYYRHTKSESENVSVFVMTPGKRVGTVTVWFNRNIVLKTKGLNGFSDDLERFVIPRMQYYAYIDGPRHNDKENTLGEHYDYLCTSGGFRFYKDEEDGKRLWILDGWKIDEAVQALKMYGFSDKTAEEAYEICGGSIREMFQVCDKGPAAVKKHLKDLVNRLDLTTMKLVIWSPERTSEDSPDTLRTMFRSPTSVDNLVMSTEQIVDSLFVLKQIRTKLDIGVLISAYNVAKGLDLILAQAEYFEGTIHKWVMENKPSTAVQEICVSTGNNQEGLDLLSDMNVYCSPIESNFSAVDSAFMVDDTLFGFQTTMSENKDMDKLTTNFRDKVIPIFRTKFSGLSAAVVYIVVPKGIRIKCPPEDESDGVSVKFKSHEVDVTDYGLTKTMKDLLKQIQPGNV